VLCVAGGIDVVYVAAGVGGVVGGAVGVCVWC